MKYGAYHVWFRVAGLTEDERQATRESLERAEQGWEWDFDPEPDGSVRIAPLVRGDNSDTMEKHAIRAARSMLPTRPIGQPEVNLAVERLERRR
jgi:hypothetical protein